MFKHLKRKHKLFYSEAAKHRRVKLQNQSPDTISCLTEYIYNENFFFFLLIYQHE